MKKVFALTFVFLIALTCLISAAEDETGASASSHELPDNERIEYLINGVTQNVSLYYQSTEMYYNDELFYLRRFSFSEEEKEAMLDNGQAIWVSYQDEMKIAYSLPEKYQGEAFEEMITPYISTELKNYYDENSFIRKSGEKYYTIMGIFPDYIVGIDFFPENKYELIACNNEYAVYEKEVYSQYFYYYSGAGGMELVDIDKNESYKLRLILKYDTERKDWFIHYHELIQAPMDEFQSIRDRGDGILSMINNGIPETSDTNINHIIYLCCACMGIFLVTIMNIKEKN